MKDLPAKYIYEPHKAPIQDQKKAGVQIKGDGSETSSDGLKVYPKPMFDFSKQREICIQGMKNAYHVGMYGNDPRVMDGTWKKAFDDAAEGPTEGKKGGPGGLDSFEDADDMDDEDVDVPKTPKGKGKGQASSSKQSSPKQSSPKATRAGHKREHSQSTLDGAFDKKRAKG